MALLHQLVTKLHLILVTKRSPTELESPARHYARNDNNRRLERRLLKRRRRRSSSRPL